MNNLFEKAQQFGKSFMLPIAVLPAAGLLLGIGGALSNPNTIEAYPYLDVAWLQSIFTIMSSAGSVVFANLALLFAIGVSVGLARTDKGTAGLAGMLGFLVMNATISALLTITGIMNTENPASVGQGMVLGIHSLETGVFGGVVVGILVAWLHNRYNKKELPPFLGFFSGSRSSASTRVSVSRSIRRRLELRRQPALEQLDTHERHLFSPRAACRRPRRGRGRASVGDVVERHRRERLHERDAGSE